MAKNIIINGSVFQGIEQLQFQKSGGGTAIYLDQDTLLNQTYVANFIDFKVGIKAVLTATQKLKLVKPTATLEIGGS